MMARRKVADDKRRGQDEGSDQAAPERGRALAERNSEQRGGRCATPGGARRQAATGFWRIQTRIEEVSAGLCILSEAGVDLGSMKEVPLVEAIYSAIEATNSVSRPRYPDSRKEADRGFVDGCVMECKRVAISPGLPLSVARFAGPFTENAGPACDILKLQALGLPTDAALVAILLGRENYDLEHIARWADGSIRGVVGVRGAGVLPLKLEGWPYSAVLGWRIRPTVRPPFRMRYL